MKLFKILFSCLALTVPTWAQAVTSSDFPGYPIHRDFLENLIEE